MTNQRANSATPPPSTAIAADAAITERLAAELNDLLQISLDGQNGYEAAAADLKNQEYKSLLEGYAAQRAQHADALSHLVRASGHTPDRTSSLPGALHEGWMNLRAALSSGDVPVFAECEHADELALAAYQEVMGGTTNEHVLELLRQQFTDIRNAYERVKALRGALEQSAR